MKKYIKSYWSEMVSYSNDNDVDGIYIVDIPENHEKDYQDVISWVGTFLDDAQFDDCCESEDSVIEWFNDHEINCLSLQFFIDNRELASSVCEDSATLSRIINFLKESKGEGGWFCDTVCVDDIFDADYNSFE